MRSPINTPVPMCWNRESTNWAFVNTQWANTAMRELRNDHSALSNSQRPMAAPPYAQRSRPTPLRKHATTVVPNVGRGETANAGIHIDLPHTENRSSTRTGSDSWSRIVPQGQGMAPIPRCGPPRRQDQGSDRNPRPRTRRPAVRPRPDDRCAAPDPHRPTRPDDARLDRTQPGGTTLPARHPNRLLRRPMSLRALPQQRRRIPSRPPRRGQGPAAHTTSSGHRRSHRP